MKKGTCILLVYAILMTLLVVSPFTANANEMDIASTGDIIASGTTGDCTWTLDDEGLLTISGNGEMGEGEVLNVPVIRDPRINDIYNSYTKWQPWYYNRNKIKKVVINESVTNIAEFAFAECSNLEEISIPNTVVSIGNAAFVYCTKLATITSPESVKSIGKGAFYGCSGLTGIMIKATDVSIGDYAFIGCLAVTCALIPDTSFGSCKWRMDGTVLTISGNGEMEIGDDLYYPKLYSETSISYTGLGSPIYFPWSIFNNSITEIIIEEGVTNISDFAFYDCIKTTDITIPDSVKSIGGAAFSDCTSLTSVDIPNSVTSIGTYVFYRCTSLSSVTIGNSVESIGSKSFYGCTSLSSVKIGNSVENIGSQSFYGCTSLSSVKIGNSVENIGTSAFYGCTSLTSITIPATVTDIYEKAFGYYNKQDFGETKVKNFTIYGYTGSEAQRYANDNSFIFVALDSPEPTEPEDKPLLGDVDGDGEVGVLDATYILRYDAGFQTPYPIGEQIK